MIKASKRSLNKSPTDLRIHLDESIIKQVEQKTNLRCYNLQRADVDKTHQRTMKKNIKCSSLTQKSKTTRTLQRPANSHV